MEQPNEATGITVPSTTFWGGIASIIAAGLLFWGSTVTGMSKHTGDIQNAENRIEVIERNNAQLNAKLDKLQDGINDVKLTLQNKQDRK